MTPDPGSVPASVEGMEFVTQSRNASLRCFIAAKQFKNAGFQGAIGAHPA